MTPLKIRRPMPAVGRRLASRLSLRQCAPRHITLRLLAVMLFASVLAGCHQAPPPWHLMNVAGKHIVAPLEFSMDSTAGGVSTAKDFRGKVVIMYFGYTHCPDVCPTTLAKMAGVIRKLGSAADNVRFLFVTVDPKRDTLPVLKTYLAAFDKTHFVGLRGTPEQIKAMAARYKEGYSAEAPNAHGDYIVQHSSTILIFGPDGKARLIGSNINSEADYESDLKRLVHAS